MVGIKIKCYARSCLYKREEAHIIKVKLEFNASIAESFKSNHCLSRSNCNNNKQLCFCGFFSYLKSCNNSKNTVKTVKSTF